MTAHAKLSASGSAKWLACPASLAMEEAVGVPDTGSSYADEGTVAHHVASECLINDLEPSSFEGDLFIVDEKGGVNRVAQGTQNMTGAHLVNPEMVEAVETYIQYIKNLQGINEFYEIRVDYSEYAPEGFGTSDCVVETVEKVKGKATPTLYVVDLKYGKGIRVDAFENTQGMLYGVGALNSLEFLLEREIERVVVVIVQPRMDNISEYEISVKDLKEWAEKTVRPKANLAADLCKGKGELTADKMPGMAPHFFNPTDKGCQWCSAKGVCKARANQGFEAAVEGFEPVGDLAKVEVTKEKLVNPAILTNKELAAVYGKIKIFQSWANGLQELITAKIQNGEYIPGLKTVPTQGNRSWSLKGEDLLKVIRTAGLKKNEYEKLSIISPTEAEKILKKSKPKDYAKRYAKLEKAAIVRPEGKYKLVVDNSPKLEEEFLN